MIEKKVLLKKVPLILFVFVLVSAAFIAGINSEKIQHASQSIFAKFKKPPSQSQVASSKVQNVPELQDILQTADQEKRLKATRALAERVGVEEALEILKNSGLPSHGEGHLAVHQVGFVAYQKYGIDSILHCRDYFLNACYHGAIIEAATDNGIDVISKMADRCKEKATRYFQCVHASGHAINAIWNYDLENALKTCEEIFEKEDARFPDTSTSCYNGAFMENIFGVHDWGTGNEQKRDWLSEDAYFPCNAFGEKYQKGCWLNQAARIYQMYNSDLKMTGYICSVIGKAEYTEWCLDNLARQIHPLTENKVSKIFELCQNMPANWFEKCVIINAGSYASVGDPGKGLEVCNAIRDESKPECFEPVVNFLLGESYSKGEKKDFCNTIVFAEIKNQCLLRV